MFAWLGSTLLSRTSVQTFVPRAIVPHAGNKLNSVHDLASSAKSLSSLRIVLLHIKQRGKEFIGVFQRRGVRKDSAVSSV
jgi:hypothetical protein